MRTRRDFTEWSLCDLALEAGLPSKSTVGGTVLSIKLLTILSGEEEARDGKGKSSIR